LLGQTRADLSSTQDLNQRDGYAPQGRRYENALDRSKDSYAFKTVAKSSNLHRLRIDFPALSWMHLSFSEVTTVSGLRDSAKFAAKFCSSQNGGRFVAGGLHFQS
jgi:hypothetical protein